MKLMKRTSIYQCSNYNCTFNPKTIEAFSYKWWKFVGIVDGKLVFNNYYYSPSTSKHQAKVRSLLNELGIKIDISMPIPGGLPGSWRRSYSYANTTDSDASLQDLIVIAEEYECNKLLETLVKRQEQYQRTKARKLATEKAALEAKLGFTADCTLIYKRLDKINSMLQENQSNEN
jgi:hypothetical protein